MKHASFLFFKTGHSLAVLLFLFVCIPAKAWNDSSNTGGTSGQESTGPVTPHSYQQDMTGEAPHSQGPAVASDSDTLGDYSSDTQATDQEDSLSE